MSSHDLSARLREYKEYKRLKEEAEVAMKALQEQSRPTWNSRARPKSQWTFTKSPTKP